MSSASSSTSKQVSRLLFRAADKVSIPHVLICRSATQDMSNGLEARYFDQWIPSSSNALSGHALLLTASGRRICLVDERCPHGNGFIQLVQSFSVPPDYDAGTTLAEWRDKIRVWFAEQDWKEEHWQYCNAVVLWLRRDTVQALVIGNAEFHMSNNRVRLKNLTSLDGAREYFQEYLKLRLQRRLGDRPPSTIERLPWDYGTVQISCQYEEHYIYGAARLMVLAANAHDYTRLEALFRTVSKTQGSPKRVIGKMRSILEQSQQTQPSFGTLGIVDILPKELDTPDMDDISKAGRKASKVLKVGKTGSGIGKGAAGIIGKTVVAALVVGAIIAAVAVVRTIYQRYHDPQTKYDTQQAISEDALSESSPLNAAALSYEEITDTTSVSMHSWKTEEEAKKGNEVWFNEEFYRRNRERLLKGDFRVVPFVVREFPRRFISLASQSLTFIPIALIRSSLFNPQNIRIEISSSLPIADSKSGGKMKQSLFEGVYTIDRQPAPSTTSATASMTPSNRQSSTGIVRYGILFNKPLPVGQYTVKLFHIDNGKPDTSVCEWRIVESPFTPASLRSMKTAKFYFGKPLSLRAKLITELQDFYSTNADNFRIRYQFGVESPRIVAFSPNIWTGPNIPAFAKSMNFEIIWLDTLSNYAVSLFSREVQPEQTPPDILCDNAQAESDDAEAPRKPSNSKKPIPPPNFHILIKGIFVEYEVPIDADNKDPKASKTVRATIGDIELTSPIEIDFNDPETRLVVYHGEEPDAKVSWSVSGATVHLIKGEFDPKNASLPITILVKDLPPKPPEETRTLRGTLALKASVKIINRIAGKEALSNNLPCIVPINVPYR